MTYDIYRRMHICAIIQLVPVQYMYMLIRIRRAIQVSSLLETRDSRLTCDDEEQIILRRRTTSCELTHDSERTLWYGTSVSFCTPVGVYRGPSRPTSGLVIEKNEPKFELQLTSIKSRTGTSKVVTGSIDRH